MYKVRFPDKKAQGALLDHTGLIVLFKDKGIELNQIGPY